MDINCVNSAHDGMIRDEMIKSSLGLNPSFQKAIAALFVFADCIRTNIMSETMSFGLMEPQ